jgi:hypothetical protein
MTRPTSRRRIRVVAAAILMLAVHAGSAEDAVGATPAWRLAAAVGPTHMSHHGQAQQLRVQATAGTFNLTFAGSTTPDLPFDATRTDVESALNALPSVGGQASRVRVYGPLDAQDGLSGLVYRIEFVSGPLATQEIPGITAADGATPLSGGSPPLSTFVEPSGKLVVYPVNIGGADSSGAITLTVGPLPPGVETAGDAAGNRWDCPSLGAGQLTVTCTNSGATPTPSLRVMNPLVVPLRVRSGAAIRSTIPVAVAGGGAANATAHEARIVVSSEDAVPGVSDFWAGAFDANGEPYTQAAGHPHSAGTLFLVNTIRNNAGWITPAGDPRDIDVALPPGFVGNPLVTDRCPRNLAGACAPRPVTVGSAVPLAQVFGVDRVDLPSDVVNDEPANGYAAQFTFQIVDSKATVVASVRSDTDFGVTATAPQITPFYKLFGNYFVFEGQPADAAGSAFLTNPTDCTGRALSTLISISPWHAPGLFSDPFSSDVPPVTGCDLVPFAPSVSVTPTSRRRDSASGLEVTLSLPQDGLADPAKLATSHLKKTVVRLPEGFSVNPSGATGLAGCSDAQVALRSKAEVTCPDASKLGTVTVTSPLIDQPLTGEMYLGTPTSTDPMSGNMLRLFLVVRNERYGLLVKLAGSTVADAATGRLTATFDNNPRLPFDNLNVKLRGGERGLLSTGQRCGPAASSTVLSPWSGTADVSQQSPIDLTGDCAFGFAPRLTAGMNTSKARRNGTFGFRFSREDGEQWVAGLTAQLPPGLLASVKDLPLCGSAQAMAGACPDGSRIGTVDATAGTGNPFVLERKGIAYLTEGYRGCPYGLAVVVPVVAGPFDASSPETDLGSIVVRQAVCVDRTTAQVSAISDPLPTIWHGIPLRIRSVTVNVDRPGFMLNPSNCTAKQTNASLISTEGATANLSNPFQVSGCRDLPMRPRLSLRLTGRRQVADGRHPGLKAELRQASGEASIERLVTKLPLSLALDPERAQGDDLCEFEEGQKADPNCPRSSMIGRARAFSPLLNRPLEGPVYFVKNVRLHPKTGNPIRTLPTLLLKLDGEIRLNVRATTDTERGKLVTIFPAIPDAPVQRVQLNLFGGRKGILTVSNTNLCRKPKGHVTEVDADGHNGRRHDFDVRMRTPCARARAAKGKTRRSKGRGPDRAHKRARGSAEAARAVAESRVLFPMLGLRGGWSLLPGIGGPS